MRGHTRLVSSLRAVEPGRSGGVSLEGTFGGLIGATFVGASALFLLSGNAISVLTSAVVAGVIGSFFDSLFGATIQGQYRCTVCGKPTERRMHCDSATAHDRGIQWISNDIVNASCTLVGALVALGFHRFHG